MFFKGTACMVTEYSGILHLFQNTFSQTKFIKIYYDVPLHKEKQNVVLKRMDQGGKRWIRNKQARYTA